MQKLKRKFYTGTVIVSIIIFFVILYSYSPKLFAAGGNTDATSILSDTANWMSYLPDSKNLSELSIPGTHDSGATHGGDFAAAQTLTITEQLESGVRFLDVRCCLVGEAFTIYHGSINQDLAFGDVLQACREFFAKHPGEVIIMRIKQEHSEASSDDFCKIFNTYLDSNNDIFYDVSKHSLPSLGEARGKIVLLNTFEDPGDDNIVQGILFDSKKNCNLEDGNTKCGNSMCPIEVQDRYENLSGNAKWSYFAPFLDYAKNGDPNTLYVNFASGYNGLIPSISSVSEVMNPKLLQFFDYLKVGRYGIIAMDGIDNFDFCNRIIATNFNCNFLEAWEGNWGYFKQPVIAPSGYYVIGAQAKYESSKGGSVDDTAMNGLKLRFRNINNSSDVIDKTIYEGENGEWQDWVVADDGCYAFGAQVRYEDAQGDGDDTAMNGLKLEFRNINDPQKTITEKTICEGDWGDWKDWVEAEAGDYFTGGSVQYEDDQDGVDNTAMNGLIFSLSPLNIPDPTPDPTPDPGPIHGLDFKIENNTNNNYTDDQIYWTVVGYDSADTATRSLYWINSAGEMVKASLDQNTVPKNNRMCANISNKLSDSSTFNLKTLDSARLFISYGSPMYMQFVEDADHIINFAAPDFKNDTDPNLDIYFEFMEFTMKNGQFWGNTSRVDSFCFPLSMRLEGSGGYYRNDTNGQPIIEPIDVTVGDVGSRSELFSKFAAEVPTEFKSLVQDYRIVAPCKGGFESISGGSAPYAGYFDSYINEMWNYYKNTDLVFDHPLGHFVGRVSGDTFVFTKDGEPTTYSVSKPTTPDVMEGKGAFSSGNDIERAIEAQLCAAFNRHVMEDPSKWNDPTAYYKSAPANYYAKFWHDHGINNLAYGYCYDDVADQATLLYYSQPSSLTISCYWEDSAPTPTPTPIPSVVSIKASSNGNYVCSDNYGNDPLIANRTSISDWEKYQVIQNADGTISLLSNANNKYVCADLNQSGVLVARSTSIDSWEKFNIVQQSNGTIALQALANNKYVCADVNQGGVLYANRDSVSSWETFTLTAQ